MKMTATEYQEKARRTESSDPVTAIRVSGVTTIRLLHAGMGMTTESGEFLDALKKHIFYGKPIDSVNLEEEIGDLLWYVALACNSLDVDMNRIMAQNIEKLKTRYPDKFTSEAALNRDLEAERKTLENGA